MNRFIVKRRLAYVVTYAAALASVATLPWALLAWRHVIGVWGNDFDWGARGFFVLLAVFTLGAVILGARYIDEHGFYLFRDEAALINFGTLLALPAFLVAAAMSTRYGFAVGLVGYVLHGLAGSVLGLFICTQLLKLHDMPVRPAKRDDAKRIREDPFFILCIVLCTPTLWLGSTLAGIYFGLEQYGVAVPYLVGVAVAFLSIIGLRACFVQRAPAQQNTPQNFRPLAPAPPATPVARVAPLVMPAKPPARTPPLFPVGK